MAMGFGDIALAFAGGAAQQVNKIADEERQAQTRMQERAQQMMDNINAKQIESDYTRETLDYQKNSSLYTALRAVGGPKSPQGQVILADYYGMDLGQTVKTGAFGTLTVPERMAAPIPMTDRAEALYGSQFDPAKIPFARRMRSKLTGTFFAPNGEAVPSGVSIDDQGRPDRAETVRATGISTDEPAWMLDDASDLSPEAWQQVGMNILLGNKQFDIKALKPNESLVRVDNAAGTVKNLYTAPAAPKEDKPKTVNLFSLQDERTALQDQISNEGATPDLQKRLAEVQSKIDREVAGSEHLTSVENSLQGLNRLRAQQKSEGYSKAREDAIAKLESDLQPERVDPYEGWAVKPKVESSQRQSGDQMETVLTLVGSKDGTSLDPMAESLVIGQRGVTRGAAGTSGTVTNTLKKNVLNATNVISTIDDLAKIDSTSQNGLKGWVADHAADTYDFYTSLFGMPVDPKTGISPTSMAYHMAQQVQSNDYEEAYTFYESVARKGRAEALRMLLSTAIAQQLKPTGELSLKMVQNVDKMLATGFDAGLKNSNIIDEFRTQAYKRALRDATEIVNALPEKQREGLQKIHYDRGAWYMIRVVGDQKYVDRIDLGG